MEYLGSDVYVAAGKYEGQVLKTNVWVVDKKLSHLFIGSM